ncbi:type II toxin-antitoxin system RelE/ParE family toxin [Paenibacillus hamazuiensis]|uniref:type II toxin-antitoxin system RelE/ParE family toxin n=1 Tax=Paenibacillus hamazuiensis TaxID=2936508 RepID=UPI00200D37FE
MKIYNIAISEPAEFDIRGIAEYIALELKEPLTAENMISGIGEAIFELEQFPYRYPLVKDEKLASQGIRMLPVGNYIVFYVISESNDSIVVTRILYGKREWNMFL